MMTKIAVRVAAVAVVFGGPQPDGEPATGTSLDNEEVVAIAAMPSDLQGY